MCLIILECVFIALSVVSLDYRGWTNRDPEKVSQQTEKKTTVKVRTL